MTVLVGYDREGGSLRPYGNILSRHGQNTARSRARVGRFMLTLFEGGSLCVED
jgi:hypothetical protein